MLSKDATVINGMVRQKTGDSEMLVDVKEVNAMSPAEIVNYSHFTNESLRDDGWSEAAIRKLFERKDKLMAKDAEAMTEEQMQQKWDSIPRQQREKYFGKRNAIVAWRNWNELNENEKRIVKNGFVFGLIRDSDFENFSIYGVNGQVSRGNTFWKAEATYNAKPYEATGDTKEEAIGALMEKIHTAEGTVDKKTADFDFQGVKLGKTYSELYGQLQDIRQRYQEERNPKTKQWLSDLADEIEKKMDTVKDSKIKDSLSYVTTYRGFEIAESNKNLSDKFMTTSKGMFLTAKTLGDLKRIIDDRIKNQGKDSNTRDRAPAQLSCGVTVVGGMVRAKDAAPYLGDTVKNGMINGLWYEVKKIGDNYVGKVEGQGIEFSGSQLGIVMADIKEYIARNTKDADFGDPTILVAKASGWIGDFGYTPNSTVYLSKRPDGKVSVGLNAPSKYGTNVSLQRIKEAISKGDLRLAYRGDVTVDSFSPLSQSYKGWTIHVMNNGTGFNAQGNAPAGFFSSAAQKNIDFYGETEKEAVRKLKEYIDGKE